MQKGNIILITFPFTDLSGTKLRPAVVIAETNSDVTVCFITSQTSFTELTDVHLTPNAINNLKKSSLIRTSKIATLDKSIAKGLLGNLSKNEIEMLDDQLKILFQLK